MQTDGDYYFEKDLNSVDESDGSDGSDRSDDTGSNLDTPSDGGEFVNMYNLLQAKYGEIYSKCDFDILTTGNHVDVEVVPNTTWIVDRIYSLAGVYLGRCENLQLFRRRYGNNSWYMDIIFQYYVSWYPLRYSPIEMDKLSDFTDINNRFEIENFGQSFNGCVLQIDTPNFEDMMSDRHCTTLKGCEQITNRLVQLRTKWNKSKMSQKNSRILFLEIVPCLWASSKQDSVEVSFEFVNSLLRIGAFLVGPLQRTA